MYRFYINNIDDEYHFTELARVFLPDDGFEIITYRGNGIARLLGKDSYLVNAPGESDREAVKREFYGLLSEITGMRPPWGTLTGVRPLKPALAVCEENGVEEMERLMRDSLNTSFAQELRSYDEILSDEKFLKHPCEYLRGMSQSQCERFLMFLAASSGLAPESALQFAVRFKNILFYPNDGLRAKIDTMLGRISRDDKERYANIKELLLTAVPEASAQVKAHSALSAKWGAYDALYKKRQAQIGKYHWELSEKNVERLYRFVRTGSEDASTVVAGDKGAVIVRILEDEKPMALRFKDVAVNADRLYSEQTGEILRYMLGQLEMFHLRGENRTQRTYPVTYPIGMISKKRGGYGEKIVWTDSETIVCELLYMAIGAELLPPLHQSVNERTGEVTLIIRLDEYGANKIETILQG